MLIVAGCSTQSDAVSALDDEGFTDITITDRSDFWAWNCEKGETEYAATAKNPRGKSVSIEVCCGTFMKGCTIRSAR